MINNSHYKSIGSLSFIRILTREKAVVLEDIFSGEYIRVWLLLSHIMIRIKFLSI